MKQTQLITPTLCTILFMLFAINGFANINAIDFSLVKYPAKQKDNIDFLRSNENMYNHWVHDWNYQIPKATVVSKLSTLFAELDKTTDKNLETYLLLGDIAHYLYNIENEEYYQKAIDRYTSAKQIAPADYRVYWFLGNHYALGAVELKAIENYKLAQQYLRSTQPNILFWSDYAIACTTAGMPATALYLAHKASGASGAHTFLEDKLSFYRKGVLRSPPIDTTIQSKNLWFAGKKDEGQMDITNWAMGIKIKIDTNWKIKPGEYKNKTSYAILTPPEPVSKNGMKVGYTILIFMQAAKQGQTLKEFVDMLTPKNVVKHEIALDVNTIKNCFAYDIKDATTYAQWGGAHTYAIGIEREQTDYPGMSLEEAEQPPLSGNGQMAYYKSVREFSRITGKVYYMILLDSCELIKEESLTKFKAILNNIVIE
jgi:tetratricopeptide (TPR) repeat protein